VRLVHSNTGCPTGGAQGLINLIHAPQ
jgi:hypothetical protein